MPLQAWMESPVASALGWAVLHSLWQGAIAAVALAAVLLATRSPRVRYASACAALLGMLGAFGATFTILLGSGGVVSPAPLVPTLRSWPPARAVDAASFPNWGLEAIAPWLAPIWIVGVCVFAAFHLAGWFAVSRLRRRGTCAAPEAWRRTLDDLAARMCVARPVALLESCFVEVPMLFGHAKPLILVPAGFLAGLPASHVEAILLHELAHVRRHDYLVNLFQRLIESVMFHHPAAWWISRVIRAERENCCDDAVVAATGNAPEYANALAGLEQWRWPNQHAAVAATGGNLTNRISRLLFPRTKYPAATPLFAASLLSAVFAFTLAAWQAAPPARTDTPYDRWLDQDAVYLISGEERAAFLKLASDPEREKFIEQFWLRRDPTPGTERNEFQIEHYRRIDYANKRFGAGAKPGWRTDRGYMYIVYGPPDEIESHPSGGGRAYGTEAWKYRTIEGMGQNLFVFFIDRMNSGDYRLAPGSVR